MKSSQATKDEQFSMLDVHLGITEIHMLCCVLLNVGMAATECCCSVIAHSQYGLIGYCL